MIRREILTHWVVEALQELGGKGRLLDVCKTVWAKHKFELESSGDLFFTWQYDIRWAATSLRSKRK